MGRVTKKEVRELDVVYRRCDMCKRSEDEIGGGAYDEDERTWSRYWRHPGVGDGYDICGPCSESLVRKLEDGEPM